MIKKNSKVLPFLTRRMHLLFLVFFPLISVMSKAICKPEDACYNDTNKQEKQGTVYVSEGTTLFVAEGTITSLQVPIRNDKVSKVQLKAIKRKNVEKPKVVKRRSITVVHHSSLPSAETIYPTIPKHSWDTGGPYNKQISVTSNISFKYVAAAMDATFINVILIFITLLIAVYQRHILNTLLLGANFQRPPPLIA
ncbi:hypothetical protein J2X97_003716 [Epilithonimonas hungarica]|uniref:hypothetical protein n=1 Tax=Epilithonimonas hungarica TaxID=454006 RepID=UPI002786FA18|nr:hypothetical protein [Epilithonimonas hungarica]MDP9958042.1 hypothetical protein [Epilithonimonas hungarica]